MPEPAKIVVIPTYNEKDNLVRLTEAIMGLPGEFYMLVVDDDSPDGTGEIAEELGKTYPRLSVMHRTKDRGLGRSYVDGMKEALARGAGLVFGMDADFSHPPGALPALAEAATDYDLVIGSRYCSGGQIEGWAAHRRVLSRGANFYVRTILGLPASDNTGAFRCWRADALTRIDLDAIISDGYSFIVEIAYRASQLGFRIGEVPITFVERREGQSKLSKRVILESIVMPWRLLLSAGPASREAAPSDQDQV